MSFFRSCDIVFRIATVHMLLILSNKFKTSRLQVYTRRCLLLLGSRQGVSVASLLQESDCVKAFLCEKSESSSEAFILRLNKTLTQNITTIESKFLRCEAQKPGVVVCTAGFRVHMRKCHGHDAVQMQAEDLLSTVHACVDSFSIAGTSL